MAHQDLVKKKIYRPPFLLSPPVAQDIPQPIDARQYSLRWVVNSPEPQLQFSKLSHH